MRADPNPFVGLNYLPTDPNVATPPSYVLQRFYDFDDKLVLFPSRHTPFAYVIARRRQLTAGLTDRALEATITQPDTKFCLANGLVPVTLMYKLGSGWNIDKVLAGLKARDIWEHGGAEKYAQLADDADEKQRKADHAAVRDDMWMRAGDAWRSYQARTGQRSKYRYGHQEQA